MHLEKLLNNRINGNLISTNIIEYDIQAAGPTALRFIKGEEVYNDLIRLPKEERVVKEGNMIKSDKTLFKKIMDEKIKWFNMFLEANKIKEVNFLQSTPDSLLIYGKIAPITTFLNNKVVFRNKENIVYTSLFKIENNIDLNINTMYILFDRLSRRIRIKGIGQENETDKSDFVKYCLKDLCSILEDSSSLGRTTMLKRLGIFRNNYLNSKNKNIYKSLIDKNQFKYVIDGYEVLSDIYMEEHENCVLLKSDNYVNFILPLIQSFL